jgi:large subunit ribosomal protein L17
MRHSSNTRKLSRSTDQRASLLRGLAVSLIRDEQITTTFAKAKELQSRIERLITVAKKDTVASRRLVASRLGQPDDAVTKKFFTTIAPKFVERNGGYTRVIKMGRMPSGKEQAVIAFVE